MYSDSSSMLHFKELQKERMLEVYIKKHSDAGVGLSDLSLSFVADP